MPRAITATLACSALVSTLSLLVTPLSAPDLRATPSPPPRHAPDRFGWPLPSPPVVRPFDPPDTPYGRGHRGVDLGARIGATVLAAGSGTVTFAGSVAGRDVLSVAHRGGLRTTYEPVLALVHPGQRVTLGQPIGTLDAGHPGCSLVEPDACLHWGALRGGQYVDPLGLLQTSRVRLLPWEPPGGSNWPAR